MTQILLFSDEPVLALGLESVLRAADGFQLAGVCSNTTRLKEIMEAGQPDILLIDLTSDVTFSILSELKKATINSKIVLWVHARNYLSSVCSAFTRESFGLKRRLRTAFFPPSGSLSPSARDNWCPC
jgi:DNA-binding NarL/FixJ family response regulator